MWRGKSKRSMMWRETRRRRMREKEKGRRKRERRRTDREEEKERGKGGEGGEGERGRKRKRTNLYLCACQDWGSGLRLIPNIICDFEGFCMLEVTSEAALTVKDDDPAVSSAGLCVVAEADMVALRAGRVSAAALVHLITAEAGIA